MSDPAPSSGPSGAISEPFVIDTSVLLSACNELALDVPGLAESLLGRDSLPLSGLQELLAARGVTPANIIHVKSIVSRQAYVKGQEDELAAAAKTKSVHAAEIMDALDALGLHEYLLPLASKLSDTLVIPYMDLNRTLIAAGLPPVEAMLVTGKVLGIAPRPRQVEGKDAPVQPSESAKLSGPTTVEDRIVQRFGCYEGWMEKKGKGYSMFGRRSWKRRYFRLDPATKELSYSVKPAGRQKGHILVIDASLPPVTNAAHPNPLEVLTVDKRSMSLSVSTTALRDEWLALLKRVARGDTGEFTMTVSPIVTAGAEGTPTKAVANALAYARKASVSLRTRTPPVEGKPPTPRPSIIDEEDMPGDSTASSGPAIERRPSRVATSTPVLPNATTPLYPSTSSLRSSSQPSPVPLEGAAHPPPAPPDVYEPELLTGIIGRLRELGEKWAAAGDTAAALATTQAAMEIVIAHTPVFSRFLGRVQYLCVFLIRYLTMEGNYDPSIELKHFTEALSEALAIFKTFSSAAFLSDITSSHKSLSRLVPIASHLQQCVEEVGAAAEREGGGEGGGIKGGHTHGAIRAGTEVLTRVSALGGQEVVSSSRAMLETVCTLAGVPTERISDVITSHFSSRVVASAEAITSGPAALIDNPLLRCVWARKCGGRDVYPVGAVVDALLAFVKEEAQVEDGQYAGDAVALAKCLDRNSDGMVTVLDIMHMCPTAVSLQTLISDCIAWGSTVPHALPSPPIPFIGYEPELKDALSFLSHTPPSSSSCLAIAGPVGCGMTSFLASLVHRLIESDANATVHFVDFQAAVDPNAVLACVAARLDLFVDGSPLTALSQWRSAVSARTVIVIDAGRLPIGVLKTAVGPLLTPPSTFLQVVIGCSTDELSGCDITLTGLSASDMASLIDSSSPAVSPSLRSSLLTYGLGLPALVPLACVLPPDAAAAALTSPEAAHNPCTALATAAGSSLPDETRQILHALCAFPSTFTVASASRIAGPKAVPALSRLSSLSLLRTHTDGSLSVSLSFSRPHVPEPALISFVTATTAVMNAAEAALAEGNAVLAMHLYDIHHDDVNYILWLASVAHEQPLGVRLALNGLCVEELLAARLGATEDAAVCGGLADLATALHGANTLQEVTWLHRVANSMLRQGHTEDSLALHTHVLAVRAALLPPSSLPLADTHHALGTVHTAMGAHTQACASFEEAAKIRQENGSPLLAALSLIRAAAAHSAAEGGDGSPTRLSPAALAAYTAAAALCFPLSPSSGLAASLLIDIGYAVGSSVSSTPELALQHLRTASDAAMRTIGPKHSRSLPILSAFARALAAFGTPPTDVLAAYNDALVCVRAVSGQQSQAALNMIEDMVTIATTARDPSLVPLLAEAVRVRESVFGPTHPSLAPALSRLGSAMTESGQVNEATATLSRALSLLKAAVPTTEPTLLIEAIAALARVCDAAGKPTDALPLWQEALSSPAIVGHPVEVEARAATMSTSSPPDDPAVTSAALERLRRGGASSIPALADLLFSVGTNASARGDEAAALDALEECVDLRVGLFGGAGRPTLEALAALCEVQTGDACVATHAALVAGHKEAWGGEGEEGRVDTATSLQAMGMALHKAGRFTEAFAAYEEAHSVLAASTSESHRELEASIAFSAGVTQYRLGQEDASLASHLLSLSLRRALFPLPHPDLCASLEAVAALLDAKGDAEQALATRLEAHKCRFAVYGPLDPDTVSGAQSLASKLFKLKRFADALPLYEELVSARRNLCGAVHTDTASALLDLAACHANLGDAVSSARAHAEVLSIRRSLHGEAHPDSIRAANTLGVLLYKRGAFGEALPLFSSALRGRVQMLGHTHPDVASSCVDVANCMLNSGDAPGGLVWQLRALAVRRIALGPSHPDVAKVLLSTGSTLEKLGRVGDALSCLAEAVSIRTDALGPTHSDTATATRLLSALQSKLVDDAPQGPSVDELLADVDIERIGEPDINEPAVVESVTSDPPAKSNPPVSDAAHVPSPAGVEVRGNAANAQSAVGPAAVSQVRALAHELVGSVFSAALEVVQHVTTDAPVKVVGSVDVSYSSAIVEPAVVDDATARHQGAGIVGDAIEIPQVVDHVIESSINAVAPADSAMVVISDSEPVPAATDVEGTSGSLATLVGAPDGLVIDSSSSVAEPPTAAMGSSVVAEGAPIDPVAQVVGLGVELEVEQDHASSTAESTRVDAVTSVGEAAAQVEVNEIVSGEPITVAAMDVTQITDTSVPELLAEPVLAHGSVDGESAPSTVESVSAPPKPAPVDADGTPAIAPDSSLLPEHNLDM